MGDDIRGKLEALITESGMFHAGQQDERLRLCREKQVTMRSPIPLKPWNVSIRPPRATPSRIISANARVTRAAFVLSPRPRPSQTPAAMANVFLSAPPNSMPVTSLLT